HPRQLRQRPDESLRVLGYADLAIDVDPGGDQLPCLRVAALFEQEPAEREDGRRRRGIVLADLLQPVEQGAAGIGLGLRATAPARPPLPARQPAPTRP